MAQLIKRNVSVPQENNTQKVEKKEEPIKVIKNDEQIQSNWFDEVDTPVVETKEDENNVDFDEVALMPESLNEGELSISLESETIEEGNNYEELEQENNANLLKIQAQAKELEILKQELAEKEKKLSDITNNFSNLQSQIDFLMRQSNHNPVSEDRTFVNDTVKVGCRAIYGASLATNDGRYVYSFGCDEVKDIAIDDLKILFRESFRNNKRLFEEDTFYFLNPDDYKNFGIKRMVDLSRENLVRILTLDKIKMIDEVNTITNHLVNFSVTHALQFEIVKLLIDKSNPLKDWKYDNRVVLENYIGQKFDDLMAAVGALELLGRKKFS